MADSPHDVLEAARRVEARALAAEKRAHARVLAAAKVRCAAERALRIATSPRHALLAARSTEEAALLAPVRAEVAESYTAERAAESKYYAARAARELATVRALNERRVARVNRFEAQADAQCRAAWNKHGNVHYHFRVVKQAFTRVLAIVRAASRADPTVLTSASDPMEIAVRVWRRDWPEVVWTNEKEFDAITGLRSADVMQLVWRRPPVGRIVEREGIPPKDSWGYPVDRIGFPRESFIQWLQEKLPPMPRVANPKELDVALTAMLVPLRAEFDATRAVVRAVEIRRFGARIARGDIQRRALADPEVAHARDAEAATLDELEAARRVRRAARSRERSLRDAFRAETAAMVEAIAPRRKRRRTTGQ